MNNRRSPLTVEAALYAGLFGLALALRLVNLGQPPLNDQEAVQALAVLDQLRGAAGAAGAAALPASPAYFFVTYLSMFIVGASDASARLGPALFGSALVLVPALLRDQLGRGCALAAGAVLAVSTSLVAASRSADEASSAVFALAFGLAALWRYSSLGRGRWLLAGGIALGLGLASGGSFLLGLLVLGVASLLLDWSKSEAGTGPASAWLPVRQRLPLLLGIAALTAFLVSTVWLLYLPGLGALAASWLAWLRGFWPGAAGRPAALVPLFVLANEPLLLVFGIIGAVRAFRAGNRLGQLLAWCSLLTVAALLLYSGRQLFDVVWISAPLAALAGWALYDLLAARWATQSWPMVAGQVAISLALAAFAGLNIASYAELIRGGRANFPIFQTSIFGQNIAISSAAQLGVSALALALVLIVAYLFAMAWSERAAQLGLLVASAAVLLAMNLGSVVGVTQLRAHSPVELWWEQPAATGLPRMLSTLGDISNYSVGHPNDIEVTVQAPPRGMLAWALRDYPHASFVDRLVPEMNAPAVIAPQDVQNPTLGSSYVGQDFTVGSRWSARLSAAEWVSWLAFRRAPTLETDPVILWVRQDVQQLTSTGN